jgi:hypothetical protein
MDVSLLIDKVEMTILVLDLFPWPYKNPHSQHHEHPKLAAFIMFMLEWELMCRDCY